MADHGGRERGAGEDEASLPAVAREQQRQRRGRSLERGAPDEADLENVLRRARRRHLGWRLVVQQGAERVVGGKDGGVLRSTQRLANCTARFSCCGGGFSSTTTSTRSGGCMSVSSAIERPN